MDAFDSVGTASLNPATQSTAAQPAVDAFDAAGAMPGNAPPPSAGDAFDAIGAPGDPAAAMPQLQGAQPQQASPYYTDADVDGFVNDTLVKKYGGDVLRSPTLRQKAQQRANNLYGATELSTWNPLDTNVKLDEQRAFDYLQRNTPADAFHKDVDQLRKSYPVVRYLEMRDAQARTFKDEFLETELGKQLVAAVGENKGRGDWSGRAETETEALLRAKTYAYAKNKLQQQGWQFDPRLPDITVHGQTGPLQERYADTVWGNVQEWVGDPLYGAISGTVKGTARIGNSIGTLASAGAEAGFDAMGMEDAEAKARLGKETYMVANQQLQAALPSSLNARENPWGLSSIIGTLGETAPQVMLAMGTGGTAGVVTNFALVGVTEAGGSYEDLYKLAIEQGYDPSSANNLALGGSAVVGIANAALEKLSPIQALIKKNPVAKKAFEKLAVGFLQEGGTEALQSAISEAMPYLVDLKEADKRNLMESLRQVTLEGYHGAFGGLGFGGVEIAQERVQDRALRQQLTDLRVDPKLHEEILEKWRGQFDGEGNVKGGGDPFSLADFVMPPSAKPQDVTPENAAQQDEVLPGETTNTPKPPPPPPSGGENVPLPEIPAESSAWSGKEIEDWAQQNGYDVEPLMNVGRNLKVRDLDLQRQRRIKLPERPQLPEGSETWDAGALRRWAETNGYDVPEIRGDEINRPDVAPRDQVRQYIEQQISPAQGQLAPPALTGDRALDADFLPPVEPSIKPKPVAAKPPSLPPVPKAAKTWTYKKLRQWGKANGYKVDVDAPNPRALLEKLDQQQPAEYGRPFVAPPKPRPAAAPAPTTGKPTAKPAAPQRPAQAPQRPLTPAQQQQLRDFGVDPSKTTPQQAADNLDAINAGAPPAKRPGGALKTRVGSPAWETFAQVEDRAAWEVWAAEFGTGPEQSRANLKRLPPAAVDEARQRLRAMYRAEGTEIPSVFNTLGNKPAPAPAPAAKPKWTPDTVADALPDELNTPANRQWFADAYKKFQKKDGNLDLTKLAAAIEKGEFQPPPPKPEGKVASKLQAKSADAQGNAVTFDAADPLKTLEDPITSKSQREWLVEAMTKQPDASKWADDIRAGKLRPVPPPDIQVKIAKKGELDFSNAPAVTNPSELKDEVRTEEAATTEVAGRDGEQGDPAGAAPAPYWTDEKLNDLIDGKREYVAQEFGPALAKLNELVEFVRSKGEDPAVPGAIQDSAGKDAAQHWAFITGTLGRLANQNEAIAKEYKRADADARDKTAAHLKELLALKAGENAQVIPDARGRVPITVAMRAAVPDGVKREVERAIYQLQEAVRIIDANRRAKGPHNADLARIDQDKRIKGAMATLDEFRKYAPENGVDAEAYIRDLGGIPPIPPMPTDENADPTPAEEAKIAEKLGVPAVTPEVLDTLPKKDVAQAVRETFLETAEDTAPAEGDGIVLKVRGTSRYGRPMAQIAVAQVGKSWTATLHLELGKQISETFTADTREEAVKLAAARIENVVGSTLGDPKSRKQSEAAKISRALARLRGEKIKERPVKAKLPPAERPKRYQRGALEAELVARFKKLGGEAISEQERLTLGEFHSPFTFLKDKNGQYPGEVRSFLEGNLHVAKHLFLTDKPGDSQGEDAMSTFEDRHGKTGGYFGMLERLHGSELQKAIKMLESSHDPEDAFLVAVYKHLPALKRKDPETGRMVRNPDAPDMVEVTPDQLAVGHVFEIAGEKFEVMEDEDGMRVLKDGTEYPITPLDALESVPMDKGTLDYNPEPDVDPSADDDFFAGMDEPDAGTADDAFAEFQDATAPDAEPPAKETFEQMIARHQKEQDAKRDYVRSQVGPRGGKVATAYGFIIISKNMRADRAEFPWSVATFSGVDGKPNGHTTHKFLDMDGDSGPYYKSAIGEAASQVKMPASPDAGNPYATVDDATLANEADYFRRKFNQTDDEKAKAQAIQDEVDRRAVAKEAKAEAPAAKPPEKVGLFGQPTFDVPLGQTETFDFKKADDAQRERDRAADEAERQRRAKEAKDAEKYEDPDQTGFSFLPDDAETKITRLGDTVVAQRNGDTGIFQDGKRINPPASSADTKAAIRTAMFLLKRDNGIDARVVEPADAAQRDAVGMMRRYGVTLVYIDTGGPVGGFVNRNLRPDILFVNVRRAAKDGQWFRTIIGHEMTHIIALQEPDLLKRLVEHIDPEDLGERGRKYLEKLQRANLNGTFAAEIKRLTSDNAMLEEEALAELIGEAATTAAVWKRMARKEPSLWERFAEFVSEMFLYIRGANAVTEQIAATLDAFEKRSMARGVGPALEKTLGDQLGMPQLREQRDAMNAESARVDTIINRLSFLPDGGFTDDQLLTALRAAKAASRLHRPDLSQQMETREGRSVINAVDELRNRDEERDPNAYKRSDILVNAEAQAEIEGASRDEFVARVLKKADDGGLLNDVEVVAVKKLIDRETIAAWRVNDERRLVELARLADARRRTGSEWGRAGRQMRDPLQSPADRIKGLLAEALITPSRPSRPQDEAPEAPEVDVPEAKGVDVPTAEELEVLEAQGVEVPTAEEVETVDVPTIDTNAPVDHGAEAKTRKKIRAALEKAGIDPENLSDAQLEKPEVAATIMRTISSVKAKPGDKIFEYWINSILSAPRTQVDNFTGNLVNAILQMGPVRIGEALINTAVRDPNSAQWGEFKWMAKGVIPGWKKAAKSFIKTWQLERPVFDDSLRGLDEKLDVGSQAAIEGVKGRIIRTPSRLMRAADQWAKALIGTMQTQAEAFRRGKAKGMAGDELAGFIARELDDTKSASWTKAIDFAQDVTFQGKPGPLARAAILAREQFWPLKYVGIGPFVNTSTKIVNMGLRLTPLGLIRMMWRTGKSLTSIYQEKGTTYTRRKAIRDAAEQLLAWAVTFAMWDHVGGDDDDEGESWLITGAAPAFDTKGDAKARRDEAMRTRPPLSIRLGGTWYSYARIEPVATALGTLVSGIEQIKKAQHGEKPSEAFGQFVNKVIGQFRDKTFLRGLGDLLNAADGGGSKWENYATNFIVSWEPNIIRNPLNQSDTMVRETRGLGEGADATTFAERLGRKALPNFMAPQPKVNLWGEEVRKGPGVGPVTDFLVRLLAPTTVYDLGPTQKLDRMIVAWNTRNPELEWHPKTPDPRLEIRGEAYNMSAEEYNLYLRASGRFAARRLERMGFNFDNPTKRDIDTLERSLELAREASRNVMKVAVLQKKRGDLGGYADQMAKLKMLAERFKPE